MDKKILSWIIILLVPVLCSAQPASLFETSRIMQVLSHDSMEGRGNFQPGLLKAAKFTGDEFERYGVNPWPGQPFIYQAFRPGGGRKNETGDQLTWNGREMATAAFVYFHRQPGGYETVDQNYFQVKEVSLIDEGLFERLDTGSAPVLVWSRQSLPAGERLDKIRFRYPAAGLKRDVLLVLADDAPAKLQLSADTRFYASLEYNIAGILPGLSRETIVFSSHYDHEGIMPAGKKKKRKTDRVMNGANDNASGTAAVLGLLESFSRDSTTQRTLAFICFAGEELGLVGSKEFTRTQRLDSIVAVVNLEMLGVPQFGKRTVFITGANDSGLPDLLSASLREQGMNVIADPVPDRLLYERSDNFPFALLDIPAHTIMGSNDDDPCYHQPCDEINRIDLPNLADLVELIRAAVRPLTDGSLSAGKIRKG